MTTSSAAFSSLRRPSSPVHCLARHGSSSAAGTRCPCCCWCRPGVGAREGPENQRSCVMYRSRRNCQNQKIKSKFFWGQKLVCLKLQPASTMCVVLVQWPEHLFTLYVMLKRRPRSPGALFLRIICRNEMVKYPRNTPRTSIGCFFFLAFVLCWQNETAVVAPVQLCEKMWETTGPKPHELIPICKESYAKHVKLQ